MNKYKSIVLATYFLVHPNVDYQNKVWCIMYPIISAMTNCHEWLKVDINEKLLSKGRLL